MIFRTIQKKDTERFYRLLIRLDEETEYMMYEPGERIKLQPDAGILEKNIEAAETKGDFLLGAFDGNEEIAGFIWAERGKPSRIRHLAYIVTGIRKAYRRQGIGTEFFRRLEEWAEENGVARLELTVECGNTGAVRLYKKQGFQTEGIRQRSMKDNGIFVDEYYMAKLLDKKNGTVR